MYGVCSRCAYVVLFRFQPAAVVVGVISEWSRCYIIECVRACVCVSVRVYVRLCVCVCTRILVCAGRPGPDTPSSGRRSGPEGHWRGGGGGTNTQRHDDNLAERVLFTRLVSLPYYHSYPHPRPIRNGSQTVRVVCVCVCFMLFSFRRTTLIVFAVYITS